MAKDKIKKNSLKWRLRSIYNWFHIKYKRWFKKEKPVIFNCYSNSYEFLPIKEINKTEDDENKIEVYRVYGQGNESFNYARMRTAKELTKGTYKEKPLFSIEDNE